MSSTPLALAFPLKGSQLIEASAGTGKTFTISALYLRLVLGHGGDAWGFGRELLPPQILVVTFTDAATKDCVSVSAFAWLKLRGFSAMRSRRPTL